LKQVLARNVDNTFVSPPTRGRGLKLIKCLLTCNLNIVAPHAGAWIETSRLARAELFANVAPHAGAWIET